MKSHESIEVLSGTLRQVLFSPKGTLEGLLLGDGEDTRQVSFDPADVDPTKLVQAVGKAIVLKAVADRSPKTKDGAHRVFKLRAISKLGDKAAELDHQGARPTSGVVAAIHYAKHGEPNGVILDSGAFVHTRPPGMKKLKLKVGAKVVVVGEKRMTVLGTAMIEADEVNEVALE